MVHIQKDVELCKIHYQVSFLLVFDTLAREVAVVTAKRFPSSLSERVSYFEALGYKQLWNHAHWTPMGQQYSRPWSGFPFVNLHTS